VRLLLAAVVAACGWQPAAAGAPPVPCGGVPELDVQAAHAVSAWI
jgi:hypothetical protein